MKTLLEAVPGNRAEGCCWLDPVRLPALLEGTRSRVTASGGGTAGFVLAGWHMVASTISCDDHLSMADRAGLALDEHSPFHSNRVGDLRGFATADAVCIEFWRPTIDMDPDHHDAQIEDDDTPPAVDTERLNRFIEAVRNHPGVKTAYPHGVPEVIVSLLCNQGRMEWVYREETRRLERADIAFPAEASQPLACSL